MQLSETHSDSLQAQLHSLLDCALAYCERGDYFSAFQLSGEKLTQLCDRININAPDDSLLSARLHPFFMLCQQDPYTSRAFSKPRGYAGDAVMLDYIYSGAVPPETTSHGRGIFACTTASSMGLSVLFRRHLLTAYINETVLNNPQARILSVASGHCREFENTLALSDIFKGEIVAFDQDAESCAEVNRAYGGRVKTHIAGINALLQTSRAEQESFDFIYSAGLYDYLPERKAKALSESLKNRLKPGGRLVVGNFSPDSSGRGYLQLIMDWHLIYRDTPSLTTLFGDLTGFTVNNYADPHNNVVYIDIIKDA